RVGGKICARDVERIAGLHAAKKSAEILQHLRGRRVGDRQAVIVIRVHRAGGAAEHLAGAQQRLHRRKDGRRRGGQVSSRFKLLKGVFDGATSLSTKTALPILHGISSTYE